MALILKHTSGTPLGEFDALDTELTTGFKGGECVVFGKTLVNSGDKSAADSVDGYVNPTSNGAVANRVVLTKAAITSGTVGLMLVDDGLSGYGVLFGVVTGGTVGQTSFGPGSGTPLGPPTYAGSGKLTVWATPGMFGVTLDACDTTASTGLQPTNATLVPGAALYATAATGLITPVSTSNSARMGIFVDFETNRSLVTTPNRLVSALNSPSSNVSGTLPAQLTQAVFSFTP